VGRHPVWKHLDELSANLILKPFPAFSNGVQMGSSIESFKGLRPRMPGLG
jgi:hypothetical protein